MFSYKEKPVATPRDIAAHDAVAGDSDIHGVSVAVRGDILDGDGAVGVQLGAYGAHGRVNFNDTGCDAAEVRKSNHETDGAVAAHTQHADVIEEDDAEVAACTMRWHEQSTDDRIGAAGFIDDRGTVGVEIAPEARGAFIERTGAELGPAVEDEASGLAASVGIEDADGFHGWVGKRTRRIIEPLAKSRHDLNTQIMLAEKVEAFVAEQVRAGMSSNAVDLVNDAWRAWSLQGQKPCEMNGELEAGLLESVDARQGPLVREHFAANREQVRARRSSYPPHLQEAAVKTVLAQAELLCADWV